jgi:hypothetical protein
MAVKLLRLVTVARLLVAALVRGLASPTAMVLVFGALVVGSLLLPNYFEMP